MNEDDKIRLQHMLEAAQAALAFMQGESRESLDKDLKLSLAVVKAIEIIGEAASRVSKEYREQTSQIPWSGIVGMRNILIHAYFDVDLDEVWRTVTTDLPPLIAELEKLLVDST
jgi:uncharacterized protein with HEPN domain